jgi:hypothetical protein
MTDDHYACFLSVLRLFTSFFETDRLYDDADRDFLLETLLHMFRFPPLGRAMYNLIQQRMIIHEDRAVLANCLLRYYRKGHHGDDLFEAQFPRMIFSLFCDQMLAKKPQDSRAPKHFLEAFSTVQLLCPVTKKRLNEATVVAINQKRAVAVNSTITTHYTVGVLRGTCFPSSVSSAEASMITKLALFSGSRFPRITGCKTNTLLERILPVTRVPRGQQELTHRNYENKEKEMFAIHAPKDVPTLLPPALTRDKTGKVCVFLETSKASPPKKYFHHSWI